MTETYEVPAHRAPAPSRDAAVMIIRVSELEEQGLRFDDVAAFPSAFSDPAWRLESIALEVEPDEGEVLVRGRLSATGPLTCSRCLETFAGRLDSEIDVRVLPRPVGADSVELGADDLDVDFYVNDELDLARVVENEAMLAMPMKPLCQPECRGLCASCGANRNVAACTCAQRPPDPRLAALRDLAARPTN